MIKFIKQEKQLESLSINLLILTPYELKTEGFSILIYLNQIFSAIIEQKTVKELIINISEFRVTDKKNFSSHLYKILLRLGGLDLLLNGVSIKNVIRDLKVIDDSVFEKRVDNSDSEYQHEIFLRCIKRKWMSDWV